MKKQEDKCTTIFFPLTSSIDWNKVVIEDPVVSKFEKDGGNVENVTSVPYYLEKGEKYMMLIEIAPQEVLAIFESYDYMKPKIQENFNGYQITYNMTSFTTRTNPTAIELESKLRFDMILKKTVENTLHLSLQEGSKLPQCTKDFIEIANVRKNLLGAIKPLYEFPKKEENGNKVPDPSKSKVAYLKLYGKGKGEKAAVFCKIYGPGDKLKKVTDFAYFEGAGQTKKGVCHPVLLWESIFYGAHGSKSSYGVSVKLPIFEMNYLPQNKINEFANTPKCLPSIPMTEEDLALEAMYGTFNNPGGVVNENKPTDTNDFAKLSNDLSGVIEEGSLGASHHSSEASHHSSEQEVEPEIKEEVPKTLKSTKKVAVSTATVVAPKKVSTKNKDVIPKKNHAKKNNGT